MTRRQIARVVIREASYPAYLPITFHTSPIHNIFIVPAVYGMPIQLQRRRIIGRCTERSVDHERCGSSGSRSHEIVLRIQSSRPFAVSWNRGTFMEIIKSVIFVWQAVNRRTTVVETAERNRHPGQEWERVRSQGYILYTAPISLIIAVARILQRQIRFALHDS